eukprot:8467521-Alexandrium_andersonii.AAC.1
MSKPAVCTCCWPCLRSRQMARVMPVSSGEVHARLDNAQDMPAVRSTSTPTHGSNREAEADGRGG